MRVLCGCLTEEEEVTSAIVLDTEQISARQLWERLHGKGVEGKWFILDVRNEEEAKAWRIEGPKSVPSVQVPYFAFIDDPDQALRKVPDNLGEAIVVCAKGGASEFAATLLRDAGRAALNLTGGMIAWGELHVPIRVPLEREHDGRFELWQFNRYGKGCLSYVAIAGGEAVVVDPSRFLDIYQQFVESRGARIVEVLETHVHADHLSGGAQLARRNGARYRVLNAEGREPKLPVEVFPLEGDVEIRLGDKAGGSLIAQALRTPGHTPGSTSYLIAGRYLLSGDTLFVQGVGRPDLGGDVEKWGRALHQTLRTVVASLADDVVVLPAHFGGPAEADLDGLVCGELGQLRRRSPELAIRDPTEFVRAIKADVREAPAIYREIIEANLGLIDPGDKAAEWELGKNECAAASGRAPGGNGQRQPLEEEA